MIKHQIWDKERLVTNKTTKTWEAKWTTPSHLMPGRKCIKWNKNRKPDSINIRPQTQKLETVVFQIWQEARSYWKTTRTIVNLKISSNPTLSNARLTFQIRSDRVTSSLCSNRNQRKSVSAQLTGKRLRNHSNQVAGICRWVTTNSTRLHRALSIRRKNTQECFQIEKIRDLMLTKTHSKNLMLAHLLRQAKNLETQKIQMKLPKEQHQRWYAQESAREKKEGNTSLQ